jgi:quercetin dioxygenase-like cupin family protein
MSENIQDFIVRSSQKQWQPLVEKGVNYAGIYVKTLRFDENTQRSPTILLKFEAGATYPYHNHPAGEEIFVLEGSCMIEGAKLSAGDYLYTPPQYKHAVKSETGCILFFIVPEEVEIL